MNKYIFPVYRILVPKPLRTIILKKSLRKKIIAHYSSLPEDDVNDEHREIMKYLESNEVRIFPYPFHDDYSPEKIEVLYDPENKMRYVMQDDKRLYFKRRWGAKRIRQAYSDLSREQDIKSP